MQRIYKSLFKLTIIVCLLFAQNLEGVYANNSNDYDQFVNNGSSKIRNNVMFLTSGANQTGSIWNETQVDLKYDFNISFKINLGNNPEAGEGATLTLHNDKRKTKALGAGRESLGAYANETDSHIQNSLSLEFDTKYSSILKKPIGADDTLISGHQTTTQQGHIAILRPSQYTNKHYNLMTSPFTKLANGDWHNVNVLWDSGARILSVLVDGFPQQKHNLNDYLDVFQGSQVYWGFTGATSSLPSNIMVTMNSFDVQTLSMYASFANQGDSINYIRTRNDEEVDVTVKISNPKSRRNVMLTVEELADTFTLVEDSVLFNGSKIVSSNSKSKKIELLNIESGHHQLRFKVKSSNFKTVDFKITALGEQTTSTNILRIVPFESLRIIYKGNEHSYGEAPTDTRPYYKGDEAKVLTPNTLTKEGYIFKGWSLNQEGSGPVYLPGDRIQVNSDMTLYSQWNASKSDSVVVKFEEGSHGSLQGLTLQEVDVGQAVTNVPIVNPNQGYKFVGWEHHGVPIDLHKHVFTENSVLIAQYIKTNPSLILGEERFKSNHGDETILHQVVFNLGEQGYTSSPTVVYVSSGSILNYVPVVNTIESYYFAGWNLQGKLIIPNEIVVENDMTIIAEYSQKSSDEVHLNINNGSGTGTKSSKIMIPSALIVVVLSLILFITLERDLHRRKKHDSDKYTI